MVLLVSAHPKPSEMAREALPWDDEAGALAKIRRNEDRAMLAYGAATERARVAAWLLAENAKHPPGTASGALLWAANELGKVDP